MNSAPTAARQTAALAACLLTACVTIGLPASQAHAQSYVIIGNTGQDVVVDQSVIDELGPPPGVTGAPPSGTRYPYRPQGPTGLAPGEKPKSRLLAVPQLPGVAPPPAPVPRPVAAPPNQQGQQSDVPPPPKTTAAPPPPAPVPKQPVRQAAKPPPPAPAPPPAATAPPAPPPATNQQAVAPPPPPPAPAVVPPAPATPLVTAPPPPPPPPPTTPASQPPQAAAPNPTDTSGGNQQASLPKQPVNVGGPLMFDGNSAALSDGARGALDKLAEQLKSGDQRLQVVAYAAAQGQNASQARRLSLSRALAVRSYLIDKGIRSTRIDVRAMGATETGGAPDRVDLVLVSQ